MKVHELIEALNELKEFDLEVGFTDAEYGDEIITEIKIHTGFFSIYNSERKPNDKEKKWVRLL